MERIQQKLRVRLCRSYRDRRSCSHDPPRAELTAPMLRLQPDSLMQSLLMLGERAALQPLRQELTRGMRELSHSTPQAEMRPVSLRPQRESTQRSRLLQPREMRMQGHVQRLTHSTPRMLRGLISQTELKAEGP